MPAFQRAPYVEKFVTSLRIDDFRVAVSGVVVDVTDGGFLLDDGTGTVTIIGSDLPQLKTGRVVRVLGTLSPTEEGVMVYADLLQDWSTVDPALLKKVKDALFDGKPL